MKKIFLPAVFFSFLLTSCKSDEISTNSKSQNEYLIETATIAASAYKDGQTPDNTVDPYDASGKLFIEVYSSAIHKIYLQQYIQHFLRQNMRRNLTPDLQL